MNTPSHESIPVGLGDRSYPIHVGPGVLNRVGEEARSLGFEPPVIVISDTNVAPLYSEAVQKSLEDAGLRSEVIAFTAGEASKHLGTMGELYDGMVRARPERKSGVIALGGGVVGDMGGFVAATYLRGIPFIQVPTTLLSQVDASVGGKVGIDHSGGKNLIGAFYQPRAVLIDLNTLSTLPKRELRAGMAEVIKHGVIRDAELFEFVDESMSGLMDCSLDLYQTLIPWNCKIKASVVEEDEKEQGVRAILNFGHTIGHAIETLTKYETYLHGEAIALGMLAEARLGARLNITPAAIEEKIRQICTRAGFDLSMPQISCDDLTESMYRDKKVQKGQLRFVFPDRIGHVQIVPVESADEIRVVWDSFF